MAESAENLNFGDTLAGAASGTLELVRGISQIPFGALDGLVGIFTSLFAVSSGPKT